MYICPKCQESKMVGRSKHKLSYLWCPLCKSTSLTSISLKRALPKELYQDLHTKALRSQHTSPRKCGLCETKMRQIYYPVSPNKKIKLDICHKCSFLFMDQGEMELISFDLDAQEESSAGIELEVFHMKNMLQNVSVEQAIFNNKQFHIKGIRLVDYPLVSLGMAALCLFLFKYISLAEYFVFYPNAPSLKTIFGHVFVHADLAHLIGNLYFFLQFSNNLETYIGHSQITQLYLLSIFLTTLAYKLWGPGAPVVGLSGVVCCAMGAMWYLFPKSKISFISAVPSFKLINLMMMKVTLPLWMYVFSYFALDVLYYFLSGNSSRVSYISHIAGFVTGYILAMAQIKLKTPELKTKS